MPELFAAPAPDSPFDVDAVDRDEADRIHDSLRGQGERIGAVSERVAKTEQRLESHGTRIHEAANQMTTILLEVGQVKGELKTLDILREQVQEEVQRRERQGETATREHGELHGRITSVGKDAQAAIAALETKITTGGRATLGLVLQSVATWVGLGMAALALYKALSGGGP